MRFAASSCAFLLQQRYLQFDLRRNGGFLL
jgi:hypothetical protein